MNAQGEVSEAAPVMDLTLSGDVTVQPGHHITHWTGGFPHCAIGRKLIALLREDARTSSLSPSLPSTCQFSARPDDKYRDCHHKAATHVEIPDREARQLDPNATVKHWKVLVDDDGDENVFHLADTASARQNTTCLARKLQPERVAIVGTGGAGSCILDLAAKTWTQKIHLFDDDRSPTQRLPFARTRCSRGS